MIFLYFLPLCLSCCLGSSPGDSCILSFRQFPEKKSRNTPMNGLNRQCIYHNLPPIKSPAPSSSLCPTRLQFQFPKIFGHTSSLRNGPCFWLWPVPANQTTGHSSFTLHTVTRFQRPELHHYYGFICHLPLHRIILSFPLISPIPSEMETMQGFPG